MSIKNELFEALGELHTMINRMEYKKEVYERAVDKCDRQARKVQQLEEKFYKRFKSTPNFR